MQSLSGYCSRSYSQIPGAQRSREEWGTGRNWTLLDQIHGLHLARRVIEQCNGKIEPDRFKYVIRGMPNPFFRAEQPNYARFPTYYRHFIKYVKKTRPGSEKLLLSLLPYSPIQILQHFIIIIEETAMKRLKTSQVLLHILLESAVSLLILSEPTSHLDCTHQGRVCRGCVEYGWSHMQQCREAAKRKKTPRSLLVQGSGEVNGQSFPMLCQSNSAQALSTTDQPVFRSNYARRCKP